MLVSAVWVLLCAGLAAAAPEIYVGVVASETRPEYYRAQLDTFGKHIHLVEAFTEMHSQCSLCTDGIDWSHTDFFGKTLTFSNRPTGYYCGNKMHLQALRHWAVMHQDRRPDWFLLVDDDTYVNPPAIQRLLSRYNPDQARIIGNPWGGGAGFAFSRGAVQKLLAPMKLDRMRWDPSQREWVNSNNRTSTVLDVCISAQQTGVLCYAPADWATAACARLAGVSLVTQRDKMQQDCTWQGGAVDAAWAASVGTCHHLSPEHMLQLYNGTPRR